MSPSCSNTASGEARRNGLQQGFLRIEVMIEGALGDCGPRDDIVDGGVVVAMGKEEGLRAVEQFAAALSGFFHYARGG